MNRSIWALLCALAVAGAGCGDPVNMRRSGTDHGHGHAHEAIHGGTKVPLGPEEFHLEFVRDAAAGKMQAYVMDGHMANYVRIAQPSFEVLAKLPEREETLLFQAIARRETGEAPGDTALFEASADWLKEHGNFAAELKAITIRGKEYRAVSFHFP